MDILKEIDTTNKALNDLHVAMKIILTLPLIEKYQKENLPSTKPMEGYLKEMNKALKSMDSLVNE
jgi:hypothetical protein